MELFKNCFSLSLFSLKRIFLQGFILLQLQSIWITFFAVPPLDVLASLLAAALLFFLSCSRSLLRASLYFSRSSTLCLSLGTSLLACSASNRSSKFSCETSRSCRWSSVSLSADRKAGALADVLTSSWVKKWSQVYSSFIYLFIYFIFWCCFL